MRIIFIFLALVSLSFANPEEFLENRLAPTDKRYPTMLKFLQLMEERGARVLIETGTARSGERGCVGDGCSTLIFGSWLHQQEGREFYSVDINPQAIECARQSTEAYPQITLICGDSVGFLERFGKPIDCLYLDSYDFDANDPHPSQFHHLKEIIAAYRYLKPDSVVMIDDHDLPHGGKAAFVINFLERLGWRVLMKGYQVILIR